MDIDITGLGKLSGDTAVVILGPNGSGKTQLAQKIANTNQVSAVSAQRRTWIDDNLPVQEEQQLRSNARSSIDRWKQHSWQPTEEINFILSTLIQDHTNLLTNRNEEAINANIPLDPVKDTKLIRLQGLWNRLFPKRKLEIGGFFPKVKRLDAAPASPPYHLRQMSDGERTVLYMAARVLTSEHSIILVDEPELHMHSRLSVHFWDEAERLRPDCRFVYVTHDLNFTLSRRGAAILLARPGGVVETVSEVSELSSSIAAEVLGAATLPFYAKRIFLYEGELGRGFASEFISAWFSDDETFSVPCGNRDAVCSATSGLKTVGVAGAEVMGLVDRDFYPDTVLGAVPGGVTVLQLHEVESILCDRDVVMNIATHLGKNGPDVWDAFLGDVRKVFRGQTLSGVVARRVRARVGDLLDGAFSGAQVVDDLVTTRTNHSNGLAALALEAKTQSMFDEEAVRVNSALATGGQEMLAVLPGKHLLSLLPKALGLSNASELTGLVIRALAWSNAPVNDPLRTLGVALEKAMSVYLPPRKI
jgi:ABC-type lipoprotein export system ATPase subunit